MLEGKKIVVVMPAYNAAKTIARTLNEIPKHIVDEIILVDDFSNDNTIEVAKLLGIKHVIAHQYNKGYGGNQKTCFNYALSLNADIIVLLHPDYQYTPKLITSIAGMIANNIFSAVLASRILGKGAIKGGMPMYKYIANRALTLFQNIFLNQKLSEYHTGYRAYSRELLLSIPFEKCSDDFIFDNQILAQIIFRKYEIGEITCPTNYFSEASSINIPKSIKYGLQCLGVSIQYLLHVWGWRNYFLLS